MNKKNYAHSFSLSEKLSITWIIVFTISAFLAQIQVANGIGVAAQPDEAYLPPFQSSSHLLGTDQLGRDVLSYLFISCRTAWLLSIPPLILATLIGVLLGSCAAIFGNNGIKITLYQLTLSILVIGIHLCFYPVISQWLPFTTTFHYLLTSLSFAIVVVLLYLINKGTLQDKPTRSTKISLPIDEAVAFLINIWSTLPKLLLLLLLTALTPFSLLTLLGWISVTYWVFPARVTRASVLQSKEVAYYETAKGLGIPLIKVFRNFIFPSMKGPLITNFCFSVSGLLGVSSTLAFLGIGLPADVPSWGKMLAISRFSVEAWWLILFPSLILLGSIFSFQTLGNRFSSSKTR